MKKRSQPKKTPKRPSERMKDLPKAPDDAELLTERETARELCVSPGTLNIWRTTKRHGLPYVKIGNLVRYRRRDIEAFCESKLVS